MTKLQHFQKTENTSIRKGHHGWTGQTSVKVNNQDWQITTMKRSNGLILSTAQAVKGQSDGSFMFSPFTDKSITLHTFKGNATESAIKAAHYEALAKFDTMNEAGQLPENRVYEIKRGQLLRFDGYGYHMEVRYVVYDIQPTNFGPNYKCIDLKENSFCINGRPRPVSEQFGIGTYYDEGEIMAEDELNNLVIEVAQITKEREAEQLGQEREANQARIEAIERGKAIIGAIPESVKAVIVADLMEDDSDLMTDYFASHSIKTIFLAFSTHTRDLFEEMRKAAVNCDDTKHLVDGEENREKYTGGCGYYLGNRRSGWNISKTNISNGSGYGVTLEQLQLAAGEGRYFIPATKEQPVKEPVSVDNVSVQIIDYSEKAFAVIGDTKPIKDLLRSMGGKWNSYLSCGAGWIFSKKYLHTVQQALG
ncbi:MAG: hypothetical protein ACTHMM_26990 [Agriterribacter sp.]